MFGSRRVGAIPILVLFMLVLGLMRTLTGCGSPAASSGQEAVVPSATTAGVTTTIYAREEEDGRTHFYNESRSAITAEQFAGEIQNLPQDGKSAIDLVVLDPITADTPIDGRDIKFSVGNYFVRISWEKHFLGACINRDVWHLGFLVNDKRNGRLLFDGHLCVWWEKGSPQFGLYNSAGNKWCRTTRGKFTEIKGKIFEAMMYIGLGYAASQTISSIGAGTVVAAFAL